jgi:hypothetical protein
MATRNILAQFPNSRINTRTPGHEDVYGVPRDMVFNTDTGLIVPAHTTKPATIRFGTAAANDYGWEDVTAPVTVRGVAATDPSYDTVGAGPFRLYNFALTDHVQFFFHVPHTIASSTVHFHMHWFSGGTDTTNTVKWEFTYTFAKGFGQEAFDTTGTAVTAEQASDGQYKHMITETDGVDIPTLTEPDGFIIVIVKRITNGATDTANDIFGISSDIHIQSTGLPTKNKAPNFYS